MGYVSFREGIPGGVALGGVARIPLTKGDNIWATVTMLNVAKAKMNHG